MEVADTLLKRTLGLMFRKDGEMLFAFDRDVRFSVWTPFMRFPIDVFFLDSKKQIAEIRRNLAPWRIHRPAGKYRYFFEARAGKYRNPPGIIK